MQPQWLWAIAAIAIPILIHFWNVSRGRVLKIGSVAFIPASSRKSSNRIQLSELLLLLLRCLFILLLGFFLAKPQWSDLTEEKNEAGWIIAGAGIDVQTISSHQTLLDSLVKKGYVFRKWDTSLSVVNQKQWIDDLEKDRKAVEIKPWDFVQLINKKVSKDFPVFIFGNNSLNLFNGKRPATNAAIHWIFKQAKNNTSKYVSEARLISGDSIDVVISTGTSSGVSKSKEKISLTNPPTSFTIKNDADRSGISYNDGVPVIIDTPPERIVIVDDPGKTDGKYLRAAIEAITSATAIPMEIASITTGQSVSNEADWIFWLSEKPIPENFKSKKTLAYASGESVASQSTFQTNDQFISIGGEVQLFRTFKDRVEADAGNLLWYDGTGDAILYRDSINPSKYILRSKFNPAWMDLVWNESFPYRIYSLIMQEPGVEFVQKDDPRILDTSQVKSTRLNSDGINSKLSKAESLISPWLWWVLLITICAERIVALHTKTR